MVWRLSPSPALRVLEGVERRANGAVADGVHVDLPARRAEPGDRTGGDTLAEVRGPRFSPGT